MLEVINAQGAQVKQLEAEVAQLQTLISLLAYRLGTQQFSKSFQEEVGEKVEAINFKQARNGTITITVKEK